MRPLPRAMRTLQKEDENMHCVKQITNDMYWVGASDRRLALFENVYPIPCGVSYNSYVLLDEKTVLPDTVDRSVSDLFDPRPCARRPEARLHRGQPHGAGSLRDAEESRPPVSRGEDRRQRQDRPDDQAVLHL